MIIGISLVGDRRQMVGVHFHAFDFTKTKGYSLMARVDQTFGKQGNIFFDNNGADQVF